MLSSTILTRVLRIFILPNSKNKDNARREFILNILLTGSLVLALAALTQNVVRSILTPREYFGVDPVMTLVCVIVLGFLLFLSRVQRPVLSASIFISLLLAPSLYASFRWGADLPQSLMMYALLIVIGGILIGTRFAFILTGFIGVSLIAISILHIGKIYPFATSWKDQPYNYGDTIVSLITLVIIALVSWMSNREIEKSLRRARASEAALRRERDLLEIKVEERTKQLRLAQVEQMAQLYRFAEMGKMASGLFHDLAVPLNLVSLNLDRLNKQRKNAKEESDLNTLINRATNGTKHLQSFLDAARRQLQNQEVLQSFSVGKEIRYVLQMFDYRAKELQITLSFLEKTPSKVFGNPVKFNQVMTNLLANALDAYETKNKKFSRKEIVITLEKVNKHVFIRVEDFGTGIKQEVQTKIFQPFVTTKKLHKGTGIGLSISKTLIERDFKGKIVLDAKEGDGSIFVIDIPLKAQQ